MITSQQYQVVKQTIQNRLIKVNLLNFSFQTVDSLEGNVTGGSLSIDANADVRRTCQLELVVTDGTFDINAGGKIFLDRYIQIFTGIEDIQTGEPVWTNRGIYLIDAPNYKYDSTSNILHFEGLDLMSKMTGARNGYLIGTTYKIPVGSNIREAMIAVLTLGGFTKYIIENNEFTLTVPIELEFDQGSTQYDILAKLRDIEPQHQIYFDVDGVFHYDKIPSGINENVTVDDSTWEQVVLDEQINPDLAEVKNSIEVFGQSHDVKYYSTNTTVNGSVITLTIADLTTLTEYNMIGFTTPSAVNGNIQLTVNALGTANLVTSKGTFVTSLDANVYYVASYQANGTWLFLGHQQAYGKYQDENPNSPFYIGNPAGVIPFVCFGGDYENIQSDELALQRAQFEIYSRCRINDNVQLTCVPIDYLDVHQLVSYTPKANNSAGNTYQYIVQSISCDLNSEATMQVTMSKFYPYYPIIS